ncbi:unnamed protein product [Thelazia callipaeda]|uniref:BHLH domain-containing protein n=1 Tax=Thelazia callipaeda TaxID=103827 RepID=A0A0N5CMM4_THECL|nr:unnamed protein product [Thelazia callipaeda]
MDEKPRVGLKDSAERIRGKERRRRKRGEGAKKQVKKYSNILFSCMTVRQLRNLINQVEHANDHKSDIDKLNTKSDTTVTRRIPVSKCKQTKGTRRSRQQRGLDQIVIQNVVRMKTFPVASISMGLFMANDRGSSETDCSVTFCFFARHLRYDFSYSSDSVFYRVGYRIAFSSLKSINFQGQYVNLKLLQPAEHDYCNREYMVNNNRTVVPCNDFDITLGQYQTALTHVIRMNGYTVSIITNYSQQIISIIIKIFAKSDNNYSDESPAWIYHLLNADRQFFKSLIRKGTEMADGNTTESDVINNPMDSLPSKDTVMDLNLNSDIYSNESDAQNFLSSKFTSAETLYIAQPTSMTDVAFPVRYDEQSFAHSSMAPNYMQYPVINDYFNEGCDWQSELFITMPSKPCQGVTESANIHYNNTVCGQKIEDASNDMEDPTNCDGSSAIDSMYDLSESESVNSEYVPQKSDSKYILSDLDIIYS